MVTEELKTALAKGGPHLGDLVWWSLDEARVNRTILESLWASEGLDEKLLPEQPTPEKAIRQACREASVGLKKNNQEIRCACETEAEIVFEVVNTEWDNGQFKTIFHHESNIALDKTLSTAVPHVTGLDTPITQTVQAKFTELLTTHTTGDVGKMLVRTLGSFQAFSLRGNGGVYFVPSSNASNTRALRTVVASLGASSLEIVPVHDSADAQKSLSAAAQKSLEKELAELVGELQDFVAKAPRETTLERRLETFKDLRARADFYRTLLGAQVDGLEKGLEQMTGIVEQMLAKVEE